MQLTYQYNFWLFCRFSTNITFQTIFSHKKSDAEISASLLYIQIQFKTYKPNSASTSFSCADLSTPFVLKL